jgi:hypothetical protein
MIYIFSGLGIANGDSELKLKENKFYCQLINSRPLNGKKLETNKLSLGFTTEGVYVHGGPHIAKADNERG